MLHGYGNVFVRTLAAGETIQIEPGAMLFRTRRSRCRPRRSSCRAGILGGKTMYVAHVVGPGRVGIQSMYHHHHAGE